MGTSMTAIDRIMLRLRNLGLGSGDEEEDEARGAELGISGENSNGSTIDEFGDEKLGDLLKRDWVAALHGIRATLVDGGEIRGAGNSWIYPEGEVDETAMDVNFSSNFCCDKIVHLYIPGYLQTMSFKLGCHEAGCMNGGDLISSGLHQELRASLGIRSILTEGHRDR